MEGKVSKEAALYIFRPENNVTCGMCIFRKDMVKCSILNDTISPKTGSCGFFIHGDVKDDNKKMPWIGTITKEEAGYLESPNGFQCKRCEYWLASSRDCEKVDKFSKGDTIGIIHPEACCNSWEIDSKRGKMTLRELNEFVVKSSR